MQQEQLDEQMLKSGTVPVSDAVHRMPAAANGESKPSPIGTSRGLFGRWRQLTLGRSQRQDAGRRGGRRGSGAQETTGGNGHVKIYQAPWTPAPIFLHYVSMA